MDCSSCQFLAFKFLIAVIAYAISLSFVSFCEASSNDNLLGLPTLKVPTSNPQTSKKVGLGKLLFEDKRLSAGGKISCATCHQQNRAFTDGKPVAEGIRGQKGSRNTPTLINSAFFTSQFWDGRRKSLENQALDPFINPKEHGLSNPDEILTIVRADSKYVAKFKSVFGVSPGDIGIDHVTKAIASFERTLIAGNSPFDRFKYGGDKTAMSEQAKRGYKIFIGRAQCVECHVVGAEYALFTDNQFHSLGVGFNKLGSNLSESTVRIARKEYDSLDDVVLSNPTVSELGRFNVTLKPIDIGKFKTPSLRNVAMTGPYMHDGSINTLEDAVEREIYYRGVASNRPLVLTPQEKKDLVVFLKALTSKHLDNVSRAF